MSTRDEIIDMITAAQQVILGAMVRGDKHAEQFAAKAVSMFTELLSYKVENEGVHG